MLIWLSLLMTFCAVDAGFHFVVLSSHIEEFIRLSHRCRTIGSFVQTARPSIRSCRSVPIGRTWTVTRPHPIMTTIIWTIFIAAVMRAKALTRRRQHSIYNELKVV